MFKFPPELIAQKGNVFNFLYVVGGLLMSAATGSQCVDVVVRTAQSPAMLLCLKNTLISLVGFGCQIQAAKSASKLKLKRLYFSESFSILFEMTKTLQGTSDLKFLSLIPEKQINLESTSANCISAKRGRFFYILICGVKKRTILILCIESKSRTLKTFKPAKQLQWLINFGSKAQTRGDVIFLLLSAQTEPINSRSDNNDSSSLNLFASVLFVYFLWMYLPHVSVFALIYLGLKVQQSIH
ncbi:uncharacterized protein LOC117807103 [Notolabrus celidotus]|uniref:uncharacterized protein LOC117807103 n=1 Tax=Notolabrus celidotus TaxID=1203425 RepID=UPI0014901BFF|nr:uncharacterized protein LOC117807103 [Notolabrus celidotus]XP_034532052.1 uncharacterized protein LOC117807103 [Notolabrus celidotus]